MKEVLFAVLAATSTLAATAQNTFTNTGVNVGIGTTSPISRLSIETSDVNVSNLLRLEHKGISNSLIFMGTAAANYPVTAHQNANVLESYTDLHISAANTGNIFFETGRTGPAAPVRMTLTNTGNLGIGTTNPVHRLDIANGSVNIGTGANIAYRAGSYVSIGNMSYTNTPYIAFNAFLTTSDIATSKNLVTPNYNAGGGLIIRGEGGGSGLHFLQKNYANGIAPYDVNSFTEVFTITSAGTVGVGTTSTGSHKFAVEGSIGARRVKVTQGTWADFVFDPAYRLQPLNEIENYIKTNRHLPEIPSAAEIQKEGLDLGEMNKKLLQKIEELTLYLIDMKKEINELKARMKC